MEMKTNTKKRFCKKNILQGWNFAKRKYIRKRDINKKKRDYIWEKSIWEGNYKDKQLHGGGNYTRSELKRQKKLNGEETIWGKELHGEGTNIERED